MIDNLIITIAVIIALALFCVIAPPIVREWRERQSPVGRALRGKSDPMMQPHGDVPYRGFR